MKRVFAFLLICFLIFPATRTAFSQEYTEFRHQLFTMQVPATWHYIPKQRFNALIAEQARRQGLSGKGNPNWQVFECGFQKTPPLDGLSLPIITVKIDENKRFASTIRQQLTTMTEDQIAFTYTEAVKKLGREFGAIFGFNAEDIILDRRRNLLRFTLKQNNVQAFTSIYVHNNGLFHIICNTFDDSELGKEVRIFRKVSDSFTLK